MCSVYLIVLCVLFYAPIDADSPFSKNDVLDLQDEIEFKNALSRYKYLMVLLTTSPCGHCQGLESVLPNVAKELQSDINQIRVARIDALENEDFLPEKYVSRLPSLLLYQGTDEPLLYAGDRTLSSIVTWARRKIGSHVLHLESSTDIETFIERTHISVIGFFKSKTSSGYEEFIEATQTTEDVEFAVTTNENHLEEYNIQDGGVVLFKPFDEYRDELKTTEVSVKSIEKLISKNKLSMMSQYTENSFLSAKYDSVKTWALLLADGKLDVTLKYMDAFKQAARDFRGKVRFLYVNTSESIAEQANGALKLGLTTDDYPTLRVLKMTDRGKIKYKPIDIKLDVKNIRKFVNDVTISGTSQPYFLSEASPADWDKHAVKVLTGQSFYDVVGKKKNAFIEFYAPWCGACTKLEETWTKLGEKYKNHPSLIIAKIDATANEVEGAPVSGYPTLLYFPKNGGQDIISYYGNRTIEAFSAFLNEHGIEPVETKKAEL